MLPRITRFAIPAGLLLLLGLSSHAWAQEVAPLRIGYTDHEILISNMPDYRNVQSQLQQEYQDSQSALQTLYQDYQADVDRYRKEQAQLSQELRAERESELTRKQQEIQTKASAEEQQLAKREADLLSPVFQRVDGAIKKVAAANNLDLVLRVQAGPRQPIILWANQDRVMDITREVARELGLDVGADPSSSE